MRSHTQIFGKVVKQFPLPLAVDEPDNLVSELAALLNAGQVGGLYENGLVYKLVPLRYSSAKAALPPGLGSFMNGRIALGRDHEHIATLHSSIPSRRQLWTAVHTIKSRLRNHGDLIRQSRVFRSVVSLHEATQNDSTCSLDALQDLLWRLVETPLGFCVFDSHIFRLANPINDVLDLFPVMLRHNTALNVNQSTPSLQSGRLVVDTRDLTAVLTLVNGKRSGWTIARKLRDYFRTSASDYLVRDILCSFRRQSLVILAGNAIVSP